MAKKNETRNVVGGVLGVGDQTPPQAGQELNEGPAQLGGRGARALIVSSS